MGDDETAIPESSLGAGVYDVPEAKMSGEQLCQLACDHFTGLGDVQVDKERAVTLWLMSAACDYGGGHYFVALCYDRGEILPEDGKKAVYHFCKAMRLGFPPALEIMEKNGITVDRLPY